jgi:hypothetical protein
MNRARNGAVAVSIIIVLVIIDLIVVGLVLNGSREQMLAVNTVGSIQAFYAAEAGLNMGMREITINADEDGDCLTGSVSHDGDTGNNPGFGPSSFMVAATSAAGQTTVQSYGVSGDARCRLSAVVSNPGVTLAETVYVGVDGSSSPLLTPAIQAEADQSYILFVATRSNNDVSSVSGGGLTWTEQIEQCGGRDQQGIRLWTAQGSPGAAFQVTINWDDAGADPIVAILHRYSGVGSFEDATGENTNGEFGACAGGTDNDPTQLTLTSTVDGSVHLIGVNSRNDPIVSYTAGYTALATDEAGSSGDLTILTSYEKSFDPAGTEQSQGTTNDTNDWCTAGIVLNP